MLAYHLKTTVRFRIYFRGSVNINCALFAATLGTYHKGIRVIIINDFILYTESLSTRDNELKIQVH